MTTHDREQATVDILVEAGATHVVPTGRNKFRTGYFPTGRSVMLAYYEGFGGWQFEFASMGERDRELARFTRSGVRAEPAPGDSTNRRMAVGRERRVALEITRALSREQDEDDDGARNPVRPQPAERRSTPLPPAPFVLHASPDGARRVELFDGPIDDFVDKADAIVLSDDNYLSMFRGKGSRAPGEQPRARPNLGEVLVTEVPEPRSRVRFLLRAITLDLDEDRAITAGTVRELYGRVFRTLEACGTESAPLRVAMPLLGTGTAGCSPEASLAALAETARTWARLGSCIQSITVADPELTAALAVASAQRSRVAASATQAGLVGAATALGAGGAARALGATALGAALGPFGVLAGAALAAVGVGAGVTALSDWLVAEGDGAEAPTPEAQALGRVVLSAADALARPSPSARLSLPHGLAAGTPSATALKLIGLLHRSLERLAPGNDRRSMGLLVADLPDTVSARVRAQLGAAVAVRNQLVHGLMDPSYGDLGVLLDAADAVLALLPEEEAGVGAPDPAAAVVPPTTLLPSDAAQVSPDAAQGLPADALSASREVDTLSAYSRGSEDDAAPILPVAERTPGASENAAPDAHDPSELPPVATGETAAAMPSLEDPAPAARATLRSASVMERPYTARSDDGPHLAALTPAADGGTRHVFELQRFLRDFLPAEELEALDQALKQQGYKGNSDDRLLEYCVRLDDPARKLASLFRERELRSALAQLTGSVPDHTLYADVLAQRVLEHIGFPATPPLHGLDAVRRMFEAARRRVGMHERAGLVGEIVGLGAAMESILLLFLRFHCLRATGLAPGPWWEQVPKRSPATLDKPSLGTLVTAVQLLDREVYDTAGETYERHRQLLEGHRLYSPVMPDLPTLRNHFSHERSGQGGSPTPLSDLRVHANEFIQKGQTVLEHLDQPLGEAGRLCPYLVRVERVVLDAWARRTIEATNDEGHHEVLFTEDDLRPGQVYLMYPLTNPLRVRPVLVPIGASLRRASDTVR